MIEHVLLALVLTVLIVVLVMIANRIKVAYPVLLVLTGAVVSLIPGMPTLTVNPELIFILVLPPLLYEAAWTSSWKELWHWRRIIISFAFVVVFLTAISVGLVAHAVIPGCTIALGLLLGGIVSPPDAVSAGAILKFIRVPKRLASILEGESLLNDASSLIVFRFALLAVATGQFVWYEAGLQFLWMVVGGVAVGLLFSLLFLVGHRRLPTDGTMDVVLTLVAPYAMYIAAEEVHASGVLSVVSGGLFLSYHRHRFLTAASRLRGENVWQSLAFLLNGLVFAMIGLDLPEVIAGLGREGVAVGTATAYGLLIALVLMAGRMLAAYGAVVVSMVAGMFITVADRRPGFRAPFVLGWAGMRGVVSLAAALSIPVTLADGSAFPHRNLILYITFVVILITLVVQGLTLPIVIRRLHLPDFHDHHSEEESLRILHHTMATESVRFLQEHHASALERSEHLQLLVRRWETHLSPEPVQDLPADIRAIHGRLLDVQRAALLRINEADRRIDEDVIRTLLHRLDLEEEWSTVD